MFVCVFQEGTSKFANLDGKMTNRRQIGVSALISEFEVTHKAHYHFALKEEAWNVLYKGHQITLC